MDKLNIALALIEEAKAEKKRLEEYQKEYANLPAYGAPGHWEAWNKLDEKFSPVPKKSVINDNLKMARRYLRDEYI